MAHLLNPWVAGTVLLAMLVLAPVAALLAGLSETGPAWEHVVSTVLMRYVVNTLVLVVAVSLFATVLAVPAAWYVSAYEFPGRRLFEWALVLPLAIPTYVAAFVYIRVPEAAIPLLIAIRTHWGIEAFQTAEMVLRYGVLSLLLATVLYPYLYLTARASFRRQQQTLIEAAQTLGQPPRVVFFTVALPMARPALVAGLSLVAMEVLNDYGAVNFFGVPTLTEGVFRTWFRLEDPASAVRLAALLTVSILAVLAYEQWQRGRARFATGGTPGALLARRRVRGWAVLPPVLACAVPLGMGLVYPAGQLALWSIESARMYPPVLDTVQVLRSLGLAACTAAVVTLCALLLSYTVRLYPHRGLRGLVRLSALGYALPGAAVAVGVMQVLGAFDQTGLLPALLSGTLYAVVFGYLARFLAVPLQSVTGGMARICGSLDEASRTLGHGPANTLRHVNIPLLRATLVASAMLLFVDILKELPLTMLLRPANFDTLAVTAFGLAKEGRIHESAFPSLLIVGIGALGLVLLNRTLRNAG